MLWFKHDSNAHTDAKLKRVRHKYGIVGYGIYWYCIELIAGKLDKNNVTFQLEEDAEIIAMEWTLDQLKVEEIMRYFVEIGLFEESNNIITCFKLAKRLDDTNARSPYIKQILMGAESEIVGDSRSKSEIVGDCRPRVDKIREDKNREEKKKTKRFTPPTLDEVKEYCTDRKNSVDANRFINFYGSKGWLVGKSPMKDWKAALRGWEKNDKPENIIGMGGLSAAEMANAI